MARATRGCHCVIGSMRAGENKALPGSRKLSGKRISHIEFARQPTHVQPDTSGQRKNTNFATSTVRKKLVASTLSNTQRKTEIVDKTKQSLVEASRKSQTMTDGKNHSTTLGSENVLMVPPMALKKHMPVVRTTKRLGNLCKLLEKLRSGCVSVGTGASRIRGITRLWKQSVATGINGSCTITPPLFTDSTNRRCEGGRH